MKILLYVEPHPIRDSFEEFSGIGAFLAESLFKAKKSTEVDFRIFSNNAVIDLICSKIPSASMICERPTGTEAKTIEDFKSAWGAANIDRWIDLTKSCGPVTDFYVAILDRLYEKYKFDAVVLWSENGAVRKFCKDKSLIALHGELGPTRAPFEETMYFDCAGTNGNAAVRLAELSTLALKNLAPETWLGQKSRFENSPDGIGIIDMPYTAVPDELSQNIKFPYIYVPLQLADDLNTIKNSDFDGPLDFLQKTLPAFLAQGYNVVIKPHPGSIARPHNLIEETKALAYARSLSPSVTIVDRKVSVSRSLRMIAQSAFVCTINSSVGYEALLLGKPPLILGDALYDVGGALKCSIQDIQELNKIKCSRVHIRRLVNFLSGHYLISKSEVSTGLPIVRILGFLREMATKDITAEQHVFWENWTQVFTYGIDWLGKKRQPFLSDVAVTDLFGNIELLAAKEKTFDYDKLALTLTAPKEGGGVIAGAALITPKHFIGQIDEITPSESIKNGTTIRGWAIDDELRQTAVALMLRDNKVISHEHRIIPRLDVSDFLRTNLKNISSQSIPTACGFQLDVAIDPNIAQTCSIALLSADNKISIFSIKVGPLSS